MRWIAWSVAALVSVTAACGGSDSAGRVDAREIQDRLREADLDCRDLTFKSEIDDTASGSEEADCTVLGEQITITTYATDGDYERQVDPSRLQTYCQLDGEWVFSYVRHSEERWEINAESERLAEVVQTALGGEKYVWDSSASC